MTEAERYKAVIKILERDWKLERRRVRLIADAAWEGLRDAPLAMDEHLLEVVRKCYQLATVPEPEAVLAEDSAAADETPAVPVEVVAVAHE